MKTQQYLRIRIEEAKWAAKRGVAHQIWWKGEVISINKAKNILKNFL